MQDERLQVDGGNQQLDLRAPGFQAIEVEVREHHDEVDVRGGVQPGFGGRAEEQEGF